MKNTKLVWILGGAAALAGAFWLYKKNQMSTDAEKNTSGGGTGDKPVEEQPAGKPDTSGLPRTKPVKGTGIGAATTTPTGVTLSTKNVANANDLKGTALGNALSIEVANTAALNKVNETISNLTAGEKMVLSYIVVPTADVVGSPEFDAALSEKLGLAAIGIKNSVLQKLNTAARWVAINTNQGALGQRRDCAADARAQGLHRYQFRRWTQYINDCKRAGGYAGSDAFNGLSIDPDMEDFAFV